MWQNNTTNAQRHSGPSISPHLLKNFNPYEVLQPQKANIPTLLVDLRETTLNESLSNISKTSVSPSTSLRQDTIDFFQDILANPSPLLETENPTTTTNQPQTAHVSIDYGDLFRKLESGRGIDWTQTSTGETSNGAMNKNGFANAGNALEVDALMDDYVENELTRCKIQNIKFEDNDETNPEDLIDEILLDKALEKNRYIKVSKPPAIKTNLNSEVREQVKAEADNSQSKISIDNLLKANCSNLFPNSSRTLAGNSQNKIPIPKAVKLDDTTPKCFPTIFSSINNIPEAIPPKSTRLDDNIKPDSALDLTHLKDFLDDLNRRTFPEAKPEPNSRIDVIKTPISPSILSKLPQQTIVKDPKSFAKRLVSVSDAEKLKFTKGPTFKEKNLVLPTLLLRLDQQKKEFDAKNSLKRRLILDPGTMKRPVVRNSSVTLDPTVLTKDCNKDRLIAYQTRKAFKKLTQNDDSL